MQDDAVGPAGIDSRGDSVEGVAPEEMYSAILRSLPDTTVFVFGPDLRYRLVEGAGVTRMGWGRHEILGRRPAEVLTADPDGARLLEEAMKAALAGETRAVELAGLRRADVYWHSTVSPLRGRDDVIAGGLIVSRNLASLRRAEADLWRSEMAAARWSEVAGRERRLRERLEFLTAIDGVLARCRDRREMMRAVSAAAVPRLGDWCSIHLVMDPHDPEPETEVSHADPEKIRAARELFDRLPYEPGASFGIPRVIRTGEPILVNDIDPQDLAAHGTESTEVESLRELDLSSALIVPLGEGGRIFGALTFSVSGPGRTLDEDDLALAQALAGRVGAAMENRRLSDVERHIAQTLQRSLLPTGLPKVPGAQVAVRYWAAGEGTEVGGDFYDVFDTGHGSHAVVIGDVCGNGPAAAAVTGSARHTIRALARRGDDHATVLHQLNDAILMSWPDVFCTVAYATLTPTGTGIHLAAVSGGHPLPLLIGSDGVFATLGWPGTLIGAMPIPDPLPYEVDLNPGDTVVFYTDGAFDLRPPHNLPEEALMALFADAVRAGGDAEAVADAIAARLAAATPFEERDDDIALVVVRAEDRRDRTDRNARDAVKAGGIQ